jgi:ribosome recycling factor
LIKLVKDISEKGRVSLRTIRRDANELVKKMEEEKKICEDDKFKTQEDIQRLTDRYIEKVDNILKEKEKELSEF